MMTELRGASNAKAKRDLRWHPAHPSWRPGFGVGMTDRERPLDELRPVAPSPTGSLNGAIDLPV